LAVYVAKILFVCGQRRSAGLNSPFATICTIVTQLTCSLLMTACMLSRFILGCEESNKRTPACSFCQQ
jgi:hypothetical protein